MLERDDEASRKCGRGIDWFRHGWVTQDEDGVLSVETSKEQIPDKLEPYCKVNCWVHLGG